MKKEGLRRCLESLLVNGVQILSIATDRYRGMGSLMKREYPYIGHQCDVWHLAKSVLKKLTQKGSKSTVNNCYHEFNPFPITCGGLHKHVMVMHNF